MIQASADLRGGRKLLIIGLSHGNLDAFRAGKGFIKVEGKRHGMAVDVLIFSGETEAHCTAVLAELIGPDTKINPAPQK